ncbi:hypothetical protein KIPB_009559, partial [Kipferlia bialata]
VFIRNKDWASASNALSAALESAPIYLKAVVGLTGVKLMLQDGEGALASADSALQIAGGQHPMQKKGREEALQTGKPFSVPTFGHPILAKLHAQRGAALAMTGCMKEAVDEYEIAMAYAPQDQHLTRDFQALLRCSEDE